QSSSPRVLRVRKVDLRLGLRLQGFVPEIADHTDNLLTRVATYQLLSERSKASQIPARESLVDNGDAGRGRSVRCCKGSTGDQGNTHRVEIVRADGAPSDQRRLVRRRRRAPIELKIRTGIEIRAQRRAAGERRAVDAGQGPDLREHLLIDAHNFLIR